MISDYHLHSQFSGDSKTSPKDMIEQAVHLGLTTMCFTDHYDKDYPDDPQMFLVDMDSYFKELEQYREQYRDKIDIRIGIELGLQPHLANFCNEFVRAYPFDFIIGSSHVVNGIDPYYNKFYEHRTEEEAYREYFLSILDNLNVFSNFDVYGHIDYVVRYGPNKEQNYSYEKYKDILDQILIKCIDQQIGIELNTGGLAYGLKFAHPHPDIIKRYKELGGEIITVGSDGHTTERLAFDFDKVPDILQSCGFKYYTVFRNRKPEFIKI